MEYNSNLPLVSVSVIVYNSAKTLLETLESIRLQTYQNLELIVSDDCSTDSTVELCRSWIEQNKSRFVRTELITVENNTGISANCNRAADACRGEWVKGIAGDDLLTPNCIQDCIDYVAEHTDTIYLFGKIKSFGATEERCKEVDAIFDYSFFNLTQEQQLHRLIYDGNCVPATTAFYNRQSVQQLGIKNDERIPFLEDWPKWINCLRKGVRFQFFDKVLIRYRVGGLSTSQMSEKSYISNRLFFFYYQFLERYKTNPDETINQIVNYETNQYVRWVMANNQLNKIVTSPAYRLAHFLTKPIRWYQRNFKKYMK